MRQGLQAESDQPALGRIADRYVLLGELGSGGMGAVHRARDESTGRLVALKRLLAAESADKAAAAVMMFEREFHTLAGLKHPRIIEVYDFGRTPEGPYYTMELLEGKDLRELAPVSVEEACRYVRDIASSLALLHARRLLHRDVTPRNVRLSAAGYAKLIDFGALATFGVSRQIIGTAPFIAPEVLYAAPLDHRTDLFALGGVLYWALTRRNAYPARAIPDLIELWQRAPARPSELVPDVPRALDELVMSLLSQDPLGRPSSAAAVIDRLNAIAGFEPDADRHAATSYISSSAMVGRTAELERVDRKLEKARRQGGGLSLLLEGPAGVGKTRLLDEICLKAQVTGAVVLRTDAAASSGWFGSVNAAISSLLALRPEAAVEAARPHAGVLAHLSEALRARLGMVELELLPEDVGARRARFQTALREWFLTLARAHPLVLAVDNVQAADEDSAAFIAALALDASSHPVVVLTARRKGDRLSSRNAFVALRSHSTTIKLHDLDLPSCETLTRNLFGSADNSAFVARVLHERSGGNPQRLIELVELLVERGVARYVDGNWVLPLEISEDELPSRFDEIFAARLRGLSPAACAIAEALSVHAAALSIGQCLALVEGASDGDKRRALDKLVAEGILDFEADAYRFRQDAMREAVLGRMDEPARKALHKRLGEMLAEAGDDDVRTRLAAGWHLVRGGAETRGADLLAATARKAYERKDMQQEAGPTVRALIAALEVYDKEGRSDFELASLLLPLIPISFYVDWRLPLKYGERAIELGFRITGLERAHRLSRYIGKKPALVVALSIANVRFKRAFRHSGSYTLREAIVDVCRAITPVIGTYSICFDGPGTERIGKLAEPLTLFGEDHIGGVIYAHCRSRVLINGGRECEGAEVLAYTSTKLADPKLFPELSRSARKSLYATELYPLGLLRSNGLGTRALEIADELGRDGDRMWATIAEQIRLVYHSNRGELEQAQKYREKVELHVIQGGTTWQTDIFLPVLLFLVAFMTGDPLAIREIWQQLERRAKDIRSLAVYAEAAHIGYLALRGELAEAIAGYERLIPKVPPHRVTGWMTVRSQFAETLILAGQYARAREVALDALSYVTEAEEPFVLVYAEIRRHLALAEAALGNQAEAVAILDDFLAQYGKEDHPLLIGLFHKARAQVALQMADRPKFEHHVAEMRKNFDRTKAPALVAQCERLAEQASTIDRSSGAAATDRNRFAIVNASARGVYEMLSDFNDPRECGQHALDLVMKEAKARAGYLYLLRSNGLDLVAASRPGEPPAPVRESLEQLVERAYRHEQHELENPVDPSKTLLTEASLSSGDAPTKFATAEARGGLTQQHTAEYRLVLLSTRASGSLIVIGGIVLELLQNSRVGLSSEYLDAIASVLRDASDVTSLIDESNRA